RRREGQRARPARARRTGRPRPRADRPLQQGHDPTPGAGAGPARRAGLARARRADGGTRSGRPAALAGDRHATAPRRQDRPHRVACVGRGGAALRPRRGAGRRTSGPPRFPGRPAARSAHGRRALAGRGPDAHLPEQWEDAMSARAAFAPEKQLIRDTFRQACASGIFWMMLAVTAICVLLCLSVQVSGDVTLGAEDEPGFFLPPPPPRTLACSIVSVLASSTPLEAATLAAANRKT